MLRGIKKYYVGLAIFAGIVVALTIYVVVLGVGAKGDKTTERKAQEIATKLNDYIDDEGKIPESLNDVAGDVPSSITYTRKSDEAYEFCVEYKQKSAGWNQYASPSGLAYGAAAVGTGSTNSLLQSGYDYDTTDSYHPSSLYLYGGHKAGKNCTTVEPYFYSSSYYDDTTMSDSSDDGSDSLSAGSPYDYSTKSTCDVKHGTGLKYVKVLEIGPDDYTDGVTSIRYDDSGYETQAQLGASTKYFDTDCKVISQNDLKVGDKVSMYYPDFPTDTSNINYDDYSTLIVVKKMN